MRYASFLGGIMASLFSTASNPFHHGYSDLDLIKSGFVPDRRSGPVLHRSSGTRARRRWKRRRAAGLR